MALATFNIHELLALKPPTWLVDGIIPENSLTALYGAPGHGKSFVALDLALSIAAGVPWQGHAVQKGYVVYISAEGGSGIGKRVGAWLTFHGYTADDYADLFASFIVSAIRINPESEDVDDIIEQTVHSLDYLETLAYEGYGPDDAEPPLFIIVDTLARCFEGDENKQEDMGNFIKGLDYLRDRHGATVLVVHHTGKSGPEERGSSAFRGACDTMMLAERNEESGITLSCTKQKDSEEFEPKPFDLMVISGWDSCVITDGREGKDKKTAELLNILRTAGSLTHKEWFEKASGKVPSKTTFNRILRVMRETKIIVKNNGIYEEMPS